ncbi:MAG TPA: ABC transporter permease [Gemmatimonadaceae bacterium]|jgi:simple sugar transport system permease protein|nr:ABC transporter permease [Gemmatimonadaceae bacterium]
MRPATPAPGASAVSTWRHRAATSLGGAAIVVMVAVLSLALLWVALRLAGFDATLALGALWRGSFGTWYALTSSTLVRATPLVLTGLAVAIAFRAGVWNIGADGQLLVGAAVATAVGLAWGAQLGWLSIPLALAAGAIGGALWAGVAAVLRTKFGVLEVISTIMLNFVALDLVGYLVRGPLQEPSHAYPQSDQIPATMHLPILIPGTRLHAGFALAVAASLVLWWAMRSTAAGFRVRAIGANPDAARVAGRVDVARTTTNVLLLSGALAGLAGAIEVSGVTFALYENISPGYGYTAIAVALLAGLDPLGVLGTGILFGSLEAGALSMQREASVPSVVVTAVEAALVLLLLAISRRGSAASIIARFAGARSPTPDDAP